MFKSHRWAELMPLAAVTYQLSEWFPRKSLIFCLFEIDNPSSITLIIQKTKSYKNIPERPPDTTICPRHNNPQKKVLNPKIKSEEKVEGRIPRRIFSPKLWFQCHSCSGNTTTKKQQQEGKKQTKKAIVLRDVFPCSFHFSIEKLWSTLKFYIKFFFHSFSFFCRKETNPSFLLPWTHESAKRRKGSNWEGKVEK